MSDQPSELPMSALQATVNNVVALLVTGSFDVLEETTGGRRLSADDLRQAVESYGKTLIPLPQPALEDLDVVDVKGANIPTYNVVVDLWTEEEGRSDLTVELLLSGPDGGPYRIQILDLHVL